MVDSQSSYPKANLREPVKCEVLTKFKNAVNDSIEVGVTPNWLFLSPYISAYVSGDVVEVSGMKIWRSPHPLPEGRDVIAVRLSPTTANAQPSIKALNDVEQNQSSKPTTKDCRFLLEDGGCDLGLKDGCEYTTLKQKCGLTHKK